MHRLLVLSIVLLAPAMSFAQLHSVEITPTIGYRWGGQIMADDNDLFDDNVDITGSEAYGLLVDVPLTRWMQLEMLASRQSSRFTSDGALFSPDQIDLGVDLTYYQLGMLWQWNLQRYSPYVAAGMGIVEISPDGQGNASEERFSASLAWGLKVELTRNVGLRLELRGFWADTDKGHGWDWDDECDDHHCWDGWDGYDDLGQAQASIGVTFAF